MVFKPEKLIGAALLASLAATGAAQANGFARGTADTEILYESGDFDLRMGAAIVTPQRGYETINGNPTTDGDYTNTYAVPSMAYKFNFSDNLRCAGTYTQPFGANVSYGPESVQAGIDASGQGTQSSKFTMNEFGLTCGYNFEVGPGKFWIIGGAFVEDIHYTEVVRLGDALLGPSATLDLQEDYKPGYRFGAAYEIPDIALRIQGMYRSEVKHSLDGTFDIVSPDPLSPFNIGVENPSAVGSATFPQSFELKAQTGVAPGWLVFGSVKWTDWSVFDKLSYVAASPTAKEFYFKDGWTYSLGVGHQFNDMISGSLSLTYDTQVSTTEDVNKDIYTLAAGLQIKTAENAKLSFGGAISHLEGGEVAQQGACDPLLTKCTGNSFAYTVDGDWVYTVGGQFVVNF